MPTNPNGFASYLEELEAAGIGNIRDLHVPLLRYEKKFHLRRSTGIRLCDWRTGGTPIETTADELSRRGDLCPVCLPGALKSWTTIRDIQSAGALGVAGMTLDATRGAADAVRRLRRNQSVSSSKVYELVHQMKRLYTLAQELHAQPGAPKEKLQELGELLAAASIELDSAVKGPEQRKNVLTKVMKAQDRMKHPLEKRVREDREYIVQYFSQIHEDLTLVPMLATEVVLAHSVVTEKGVTILRAPGAVVNYLARIGGRKGAWRMRDFEIHAVPESEELLETALGIWEPAQFGALSKFENAVAAAALL